MAFFAGLLFFFGLVWLISRFAFKDYFISTEIIAAWATAIMFILIGIAHFAKPEKIEAMIPSYLREYARTLNYASGFFEILLGVLIIFPQTRWLAAAGLILLLIAVFPANISVAWDKPNFYNVSRLFFQPVYLLWIYYFFLKSSPLF